MGHDPKRVFIKENGTYVAISYPEFCERRLQNFKKCERFFLPVQGCLLETDQETYHVFYREKERARYLEKLEREAGVLSLNDVDLDREVMHSPFHDSEETLEEQVLSNQLNSQLQRAISWLTLVEKELLFRLYYDNRTERELAEQYGLCRSAIHKRKMRILQKLKKLLDSGK